MFIKKRNLIIFLCTSIQNTFQLTVKRFFLSMKLTVFQRFGATHSVIKRLRFHCRMRRYIKFFRA